MSEIIEFVGHSASGKSTITSNLMDDLTDSGYKVNSPTYSATHNFTNAKRIIYIILNAMASIVKQPRNSIRLYYNIQSTKQQSLILNIKLWIYAEYLANLYRKHNSGRITLFDQGAYQFIYSLNLTGSKGCADTYNQIVNHITGDVTSDVIIVNIPIKISLDRLVERETNHTIVSDLMNDNEDVETICKESLKSVKKLIEIRNQNVVEVSTVNQTADECSELIVSGFSTIRGI